MNISKSTILFLFFLLVDRITINSDQNVTQVLEFIDYDRNGNKLNLSAAAADILEPISMEGKSRDKINNTVVVSIGDKFENRFPSSTVKPGAVEQQQNGSDKAAGVANPKDYAIVLPYFSAFEIAMLFAVIGLVICCKTFCMYLSCIYFIGRLR